MSWKVLLAAVRRLSAGSNLALDLRPGRGHVHLSMLNLFPSALSLLLLLPADMGSSTECGSFMIIIAIIYLWCGAGDDMLLLLHNLKALSEGQLHNAFLEG